MRFSCTVWQCEQHTHSQHTIPSVVGVRNLKTTYVSGADNSTVPVAHHDIVPILETIGARAVADALLALLELLEETEIPGN